MSISSSNEMFVNMKNIPEWNKKLPYWEQEKSVLQFYREEWRKINHGITIGGIHLHPWLYFHLNYFKTPIPQPDKTEKIMNPPLRDNEWYFMENYQAAEQLGKVLLMFGTRRYSKSSIISSVLAWLATTKENGKSEVIGGSDPDLKQLTGLIKTGMINMHPAFKLPSNTQDWNSHIKLGVKHKSNEEIPYSEILIKNAVDGMGKASEKGAGGSPVGWVADEIGKWAFIQFLMGALPAFKTVYGMKLVPIATGCLTAGNKVWDKFGNLINIEDVTKKTGIIGFDINKQVISEEPVTHVNPPILKECIKIITNKGTEIECSYDHPILKKYRNRRAKFNNKWCRKIEFVEAKDIEVGDQLTLVDEFPLQGTKEMWHPYLVGALIGDGSYGFDSTPTLSNEDDDVWNYLTENNIGHSIYVTRKTKNGRDYREGRIQNITKQLRDLGIFGQVKTNKDLPINIHSYSYNSIVNLISGLFDTDGMVVNLDNNYYISLSSASKILVDSLKLLLIRLGIHSSISFIKPDTRDRKIKSKNGYYIIGVYDNQSIIRFYEKIVLRIKRKQYNLEQIYQRAITKGKDIDSNFPGCRFEKVRSIEKTGLQFVYNLTADKTNTYLANGLITHNTSGNVELSADAATVLSNPDMYDIMPMDWDRLENKIPDITDITWKRSKFGIFVPAQMTGESGFIKLENNLADYLKVDDKELKKINIKTTDWKNSNTLLKEELDKVKKNSTLTNKRKMYYPTCTEDCFLSDTANPFPSNEARLHRQKLIEEGQIGKNVDIFVKEGTTLGYEFSSKNRIPFPFTGGGIHDAPVVLFDEPPTSKPSYGEFVSGMDSYKQKKSGTDSVGTLYILQRRMSLTTPIELIKASYASRPHTMTAFNRTSEMLIEGWNAECLIENADTSFIQYLDRFNKAESLLADGVEWSKTVNPNSKPSNNLGYYPTEKNKAYVLSEAISYCWEKIVVGIDDHGEEIIKLGVEFIPDIDLLDEIINFYYGGNFDRLIGFGSALAWARQLDKLRIIPQVNTLSDIDRKKKISDAKMMNKGFVTIKRKKDKLNF